ncbi:MAG: TetR/AcrR family transcriptional regulator [Actinomycetes bacterium]
MTESVVVRGRPRSAEAEESIIAAVLWLVAEQGLGALTVESVAQRAGVGKATVYRRWPNKDALVLDALTHLNDDLPEVQGSTLRERLASLLSVMRCRPQATMSVRLIPRVVSHRDANPDLYRCFFEQVVAPRRERFLVELRAAAASGEIRDDVDLELAVNALVGPVLYQSLVIPEGHEAGEKTVLQLVDLVLNGLSPHPWEPEPTPGR